MQYSTVLQIVLHVLNLYTTLHQTHFLPHNACSVCHVLSLVSIPLTHNLPSYSLFHLHTPLSITNLQSPCSPSHLPLYSLHTVSMLRVSSHTRKHHILHPPCPPIYSSASHLLLTTLVCVLCCTYAKAPPSSLLHSLFSSLHTLDLCSTVYYFPQREPRPPLLPSPSIPCHPNSLLRLLSACFIPYAPCTHCVSSRFSILLIPYPVLSRPSDLSPSQLSHRVLPFSLHLPHSVFCSHTFLLSLFSEHHAHSQCSPLHLRAPPASPILHMWFYILYPTQ